MLALRDAAAEAIAHAAHGDVALVFGTEMSGLSNDELARCSVDRHDSRESATTRRSISPPPCRSPRTSCAQAATDGASGARRGSSPRSFDEIEALYAHGTRTLADMRFLDPRMPRRLLPRLRRLFARAGLEKEEVSILRGILARIDQILRR